MRLAQFYSEPYIEQALDCYLSAVPATWSINHKFDLYKHAEVAFGTEEDELVKQEAFDYIYESLRSGWQVFRKAAGPCWTAEKTFRVLRNECQPCSRTSLLTSVNLIKSDSKYKVQACLSSMGEIKPTVNYPSVYPWMAASKFLHFFNPRLFPIYDKAFMWERVADGVFKRDYQDFCQRHGFHPRENTQRFNLQYTLWASEVMSGADNECMTTFAKWFASQVDSRIASATVFQDITQYYASAFEIVAIGAAHRDAS